MWLITHKLCCVVFREAQQVYTLPQQQQLLYSLFVHAVLPNQGSWVTKLGLLDVQVLDDGPAGLCAGTVQQVRRHSGDAAPMVHALYAMHVVFATRRVCPSLVVLLQMAVADQSWDWEREGISAM